LYVYNLLYGLEISYLIRLFVVSLKINGNWTFSRENSNNHFQIVDLLVLYKIITREQPYLYYARM
jgi:hypothetical protein